MLRAIIVLSLFYCATAFAQWTEPTLVDSFQDNTGINTWGRDWCPFVTADGQYLYYATDHVNNDIYVSRWAGDHWADPLMMPFCPRDTDERNPTVNATNDTLYFVAWRGNWDIFWCFRTGPEDTSWSEPQRMPDPINSTGIEFAVWCTPDNQRLLISSWRVSANGFDIYECRRDPTTETGWSNPVALAGQLNTWDLESYPSMGFDTTELFFIGRNDQICISTLSESGWTFGNPVPEIINRHAAETTPGITADGRRLYFSSRWGDPPTGGEIWYSDRTLDAGEGYFSPPSRQGLRMEIYPNPVRDGFMIRVNGNVEDVRLFNLLGQSVDVYNRKGGYEDRTWTYTGRNLPSGMYFLVGQGEEQSIVKPIQIIK